LLQAKDGIKACMQCGATQTPQWRKGPDGLSTLCNACGVRAKRAQQQGKNPGQAAHTGGAGGKKKSAAAAKTVSFSMGTQQSTCLPTYSLPLSVPVVH